MTPSLAPAPGILMPRSAPAENTLGLLGARLAQVTPGGAEPRAIGAAGGWIAADPVRRRSSRQQCPGESDQARRCSLSVRWSPRWLPEAGWTSSICPSLG